MSHRIDQMIEEQTARPALKDGVGNNYTYGQMRDRVNAIAAALIASGVTEGSPVGVFQNPSADWICSMLAIFRVGATYVPLDLRNSISRIASIVEIAEVTAFLTDRHTASKLGQIAADSPVHIVVSDIPTSTSIPNRPNRAKPESRAVLLFTSGTTGKPKGVVLTHNNLRTQCEGYSRMVGLPLMVSMVLQQTNYNFDISLDQIFAALADGGCLYVVPAEKRGDPEAITEIMAQHSVTYTVATPSEYETWFRYAPDNLANCKSWQYAFGGGEHLHASLINEFATLAAHQVPGLKLFNNYGPTEASLAITKGEVKHSDPDLEHHVPAGWIIPNYNVAVVDDQLQPVPFETSGEIVAGGPGIAAGYLGQESLTEEKFISGEKIHPLAVAAAKTWYRTGDRGRLRHDGALYVDGRIVGDLQVKIRGFRVELQEIEAVLLQASKGALTHAVASARGTGEDRFLAAHVMFAPDYPKSRRQVLLYNLESKLPLPSYMQPAIIVALASIPVTSNFKLDRKAIQALALPESGSLGDNLADIEKKVAQLWRDMIPHGVRDLTSETNFFDVGGNSILLVKLKAAIQRELKAAPPLTDLMNSSTLEGMARHVRAAAAAGQCGIDWEAETATPESLRQLVRNTPPRATGKTGKSTVVLAGATGYVGRHLLARLIAAPEVDEIHCLVRQESRAAASSQSPKVRLVTADLAEPNLGLTEAELVALADKTDVIVNCVANRSFWDGYETLRPVNVNAVKALAALSARAGGAPLHHMSSGAVDVYGDSEPPTDGSDGYAASKWCAERFLRNAAADLGLAVHIHRPVATAAHGAQDTEADKAAIQADLTHILGVLGQRPDFSGVSGYIDVAPVAGVVEAMARTILAQGEAGQGVQVVEHKGQLRLQITDFAAHMERNEELRALPTTNPLFWFADAKRAGFAQLITAQRLVMKDGEREIVSQR